VVCGVCHLFSLNQISLGFHHNSRESAKFGERKKTTQIQAVTNFLLPNYIGTNFFSLLNHFLNSLKKDYLKTNLKNLNSDIKLPMQIPDCYKIEIISFSFLL
jgi:hypothetical protein